MPVHVWGIDEAGYGPMLGPLCVGRAGFRVEHFSPGEPAPDLWDMLSAGVSRSLSTAHSRIAIADSKQLKGPGPDLARRVRHLERGVLAHLRWAGQQPEHDHDLFAHLGVQLDDRPWYASRVSLPCGNDAASLGIDANRLHACAERAGVRLLGLGVRCVGETEFNAIIREGFTKARTTMTAIADHVRTILDADPGDAPVRIVCDRLGGRTRYARALEPLLQTPLVPLREDEEVSRYEVGGTRGRVILQFQVRCESAHLPVALASMGAKLVRELAMERFNRYWCGRLAELKPTAGYVQDARRWLGEVEDRLSRDERGAMVRLA